MQFISENGGSTNAFTATEQTTYLFSINSSMFSELEYLSSAIKSLLFDPSMVEKEISAVNSEWLLARQRNFCYPMGWATRVIQSTENN